jgi:hypothetical protein
MLRFSLFLAFLATLSACSSEEVRTVPPPPPHVRYICDPTLSFTKDSAILSDQSKTRLTDLLGGKGCPAWTAWHKEPGASFIVRGHADEAGSPKANMALSLRRAEATRDFLVSLGVERDKIDVVGYGDTEIARLRAPVGNPRLVVSLVRNGKEMSFQ